MPINVEQDQDERVSEVKREEVQESPKIEIPEVRQPIEVDGYKVRVTSGVRFMWMEKIIEYKRGDRIKVSKDMFDILWKRGCITLEP